MENLIKKHEEGMEVWIDKDNHDLSHPAKTAAKITKEIALGFLEYYDKTAKLDFFSTGENHGKSKEIIFDLYIDSLNDYKHE